MKKKENNKSFGILFFIIFLLIALWPLINSGPIRLWALGIASLFFVLGIINSKNSYPHLSKSWIKLGENFRKNYGSIVIGFIYFTIITPIGLFIRLI